jgi:hypothetical protein
VNERLGREARELIERARREEAVADADELARIRRRVIVAASGSAVLGTLGKALALKGNGALGIPSLLKAALIGSGTGAVAIGVTLMLTAPTGSSAGARAPASVSARPPAARTPAAELAPAPAPSEAAPSTAPEASAGSATSSPSGAENLPASNGGRGRVAREAQESRAPSFAPAAPQSPTAPAAPEAGTLAPELALLERVQAELRSGHGERALELLDKSSLALERSQLRAERLAAEVFAACQAGDLSRARGVMKRFLQDYPNTPAAARVRASCAGAESGK